MISPQKADATERWEFTATPPEPRFSHESLLSRHTVGMGKTSVWEQTGWSQGVFNGATEDTNRQIQQATVTWSVHPSVCPSFCLSLRCLFGFVHGCGSLRLSLSSPSPSVTLFPLILFSVCRRVCRSLSITPCVCACTCVIFFFFKLISHCLHLSIYHISVPSPAHVSSLLSSPISLSVCLFQSVCLSVYLDLFWLIFFFLSSMLCRLCAFHVHRHTHR